LALNAAGVPHKFDVTLPLARLSGFDVAVREALVERYPEGQTHHLRPPRRRQPPRQRAWPRSRRWQVDGLVLHLAAAYGGSISAEHGVGQSRRPFVELTRTARDIDAMRQIKRALDPAGLLNPGKGVAG
jgi:FAD/FMN-containing dehydrogenase